MEPTQNDSILHRVKKLTNVDDVETANKFLDRGWVLLAIRNVGNFNMYTLGWPHKNEPEWPEIRMPKFYLPNDEEGAE